jgi:hypothetical protein
MKIFLDLKCKSNNMVSLFFNEGGVIIPELDANTVQIKMFDSEKKVIVIHLNKTQ